MGSLVNKIPGMGSLSEKKTLSLLIEKLRNSGQTGFDFYPKSFILPEELNEF